MIPSYLIVKITFTITPIGHFELDTELVLINWLSPLFQSVEQYWIHIGL